MSEKLNDNRVEFLALYLILVCWLLIGLYCGIAGWIKAEVDVQIELAKDAPERSLIYQGMVIRSPEDLAALLAREWVRISIFAWVYEVPHPLPQAVSSLGFGVLGSIIMILRSFLFKKVSPDLKILLLRPIYGALIALLSLGALNLLPAVLTVDGKILRPTSLLFASFLAGAYAERVWMMLQTFGNKIFSPSPVKST